ncbi:hypothetical protein OR1_01622 [Geobacter sp. OR-1]|nr:hypothetical protein OR1_01622 [Geobacter sp. OR-1]
MAINAAEEDGNKGKLLTQEQLEHAASLQTASISELSRICTTTNPVAKVVDLPFSQTQKNELNGVMVAWDWMRQSGRGFNLLISTTDATTGIHAVSALAGELGVPLRVFDFETVSSILRDEMLVDPVTQRKVYPMTLAFSDARADSAITLFVDWTGEAARIINSEFDNDSCSKYQEMLAKLRTQRGFFCLVTKGIKSQKIPVEFHHHLTLTFPSNALQVRQWQANLANEVFSEQELTALVEKNPMHIAEIDSLATKAEVRALIQGRNEPGLRDIYETIAQLRGKSVIPVLFGGG